MNVIIGVLVLFLSFFAWNGVTNAQSTGAESTAVPMNEMWSSNFPDDEVELYHFEANPTAVTTVMVFSEGGTEGIVANLMRVGNFSHISSMDINVVASIFCVPMGEAQYLLSVERGMDDGAQSYEAMVTNEPTVYCDLDIIRSTRGTSLASSNSGINFAMPLSNSTLPVEINLGVSDEILSPEDGLRVTPVVDANDDLPSVIGRIEDIVGDLQNFDVNVLSVDDLLSNIDFLDPSLIGMDIYPDEWGMPVFDVLLGSLDGVNISDDLMLNDLGFLINIVPTDTGLLIDIDVNRSGLVDVNIDDGGAGLQLLGDDVLHLNGIGSGFANCTASPAARFETINIRALPDHTSAIQAVVDASSTLPLLGQLLDGTWVQVDLLDGRIGYVSANILSLASVCASISLPEILLDGSLDLDVTADVDVNTGIVDADVDINNGDVNANVDVNTGIVDANVNIGNGGVDVNANVDVNTGVVDANVDANVNVNNGDVNANVDVNTDVVDANVDANVDLNNGDVNVNADVGGDDLIDVNIDDDGLNVNLGGDDGVDLNIGGSGGLGLFNP